MTGGRVKAPVEVELQLVAGTEDEPGHTIRLSVDGGPVTTAPLGDLGRVEELTKVFDRGVGENDREQAGERLFSALLDGDLGTVWTELRSRATPRRPLRIRMDIEAPELRPLPWELLRHQGQWLWRRPELRWRRGVADDSPIAEVRELGPLRALLVVCNPPHDDRLLAEQELATISGALEHPGRTHLEVLDAPRDATELAERIDRLRPHIVHFIGHGMPRPGAGSPVLVFVPAHEGAADWELTAEAIADLTHWHPLLVVLNACHSGKADPADWIGGMAHAFLDAGTKAVISMQDDMDSDAAVAFSAKFYEELGHARPLDDAVAAARSHLARHQANSGSWSLPVLLTRCAPDLVLPIDSSLPPNSSVDDIRRCRQYVELKRFVGRSEERRLAWWALDDPALTPSRADRPVLVIGGHSQTNSAKTGKTWLTNWCLVTWFLRGHHVVSVNLKAPLVAPADVPTAGSRVRHKDWLSALRLIRQEATSPEQLCQLPETAFGKFNAVLNHLAGASALPGAELEPAEDAWLPFNDEIGDPYDKRKAIVVDAFVHALRTATAGQPLVLALDHAESVMPGAFTEILYKLMVRPIAYGHAAPLRLIIVAPDTWLSDVLPDSDSHMLGRVSVGDFDSAQFMRLSRAYARRLGVPLDERMEQALEGISRLMAPHFGVETFEHLTQVLPQWRTARAQQGVLR
ncbi:CHAT domain-containing protein [Streptomyces panaciradicis]|uniref:CHAT domain-containing protein n=1 Tax=Streptomyces panaciradicis TaxID=1470261 RepID=UPI00201CC71B|nr:CHAT domain-containing protein [Streptomyces panaciradicis]MCL6671610.1 CHAT domain-containing protein [Streptomyces panaciradicis]